MMRVFTKKIGQYEPGVERDFPVQTWKTLEANIGAPMDEWSRTTEKVMASTSELRAKYEALEARVAKLEKGKGHGS